MWRLVGIQGVYSGRFFDLKMDNITIGKDEHCGISLHEDGSVAENQSEFLLCNGSYVFKDLDSTCPTTINGAVPVGMVTLSNGDTVQIGESIFRVENMEAPSHTAACAFSRAKESNKDRRWTRMISLRLALAILLIIVVIAAVVVPNIRRANEYRAKRAAGMRMAQETISSLKSIGSALKVGVSHDEYGRKVIDAQTQVDAYISKFSKDEFSGLGAQLVAVQQAYVDAGELWDYKINYDEGNFFSEYGVYSRETEERATELYRMCRTRYPETFKPMKEGGAKMDSVFQPLHTDTAMQLIWHRASEAMSKVKLPDSDY